MSGTILAEVNGFTPVIDVLAQEVGLFTAAVYGVVWRFCQMEEHVCKASLTTIAERIGVSPATALSHVKKLCDAGYLKDLTPGRRNKPHVYQDTGRVQLLVGMSVHSVDEREYSVDEREYSAPKRHVRESELKIVSKRAPKKVIKTAADDAAMSGRAKIVRRAEHLFGLDRAGMVEERINEMLEDHSEQDVLKAFDKAVDANAANWNYIEVVLGDRAPRETTRQRDPKPTGRVPQW